MKDWVGQQLGQYEITAEIGRGGMAVVYRAWQPSLERSVAIKVLPPHLAFDQAFLARFRREALSAAQLKHPNIVTIHDVGQEGDTHFIVMEYLEGQPLYDILQATGPMPLERAVYIVRQVAAALDYAHGQGLIHRDIKPANIIIGSDDHATLTDFGIAKAASGTSLTQTGTMVGTPQYMAPEQVQGTTVDPRTDVYALGIVCYEMLSGGPPFTGDTAAVLYAQAHKSPPSLRQRLPRLPTSVEQTLERALSKEPDRRFASAGEMAAALAAPLERPSPTVAATPARPTSAAAPAVRETPQSLSRPAPARPSRWSELNLGLLLGVGAAAVVLVGLLAFIFLGGSGQPGPAAGPTETATTVPTGATASPSVRPPVSPTPPAEATAIASPSDPTVTPEPPSPTPTDLSLRLAFVIGSPGDADVYVISPDGSNRQRLVGGPADAAEPDWSPAGQRIAYQSDRAGNYDIWAVDVDGGEERQLTSDSVDEREPDWSPDGRRIVYRRGGDPNGDGELWVMDADGGGQGRLDGRSIGGRAPVWSPAGDKIVFMSEQSGSWNVFLYDLNRHSIRRLTDCSAHCRFPGWSPDGQYVVYHSTRNASSFTPVQVWRHPVDRGAAELLIGGNNPGRAAWSAAGMIAVNTDDGLEIMNEDGTRRRALRNSDDGWAPDWSR